MAYFIFTFLVMMFFFHYVLTFLIATACYHWYYRLEGNYFVVGTCNMFKHIGSLAIAAISIIFVKLADIIWVEKLDDKGEVPCCGCMTSCT